MAKAKKCMVCNTTREYGWVTIPNKQRNSTGGVGYVCRACAEERSYSDSPSIHSAQGKETSESILIAPELEYMHLDQSPIINGIEMLPENVRAYASSLFNGFVSYDCTVDGEVNMAPFRNLCAFRDRLGQFAKVVNMSHYKCGAHINVSHTSWSRFGAGHVDLIKTIMHDFAEYLYYNEDEVLTVFGRPFGSYCEYTNRNFVHGSWLNIREEQGLCLEYRIAHYVSVEQYMRALDFCKRSVLILTELFERADYSPKAVKRTTDKLIKVFQKAAALEHGVDRRSIKTDTDRRRIGREY